MSIRGWFWNDREGIGIKDEGKEIRRDSNVFLRARRWKHFREARELQRFPPAIPSRRETTNGGVSLHRQQRRAAGR